MNMSFLNPYTLRKYAALMFAGAFSTMAFFIITRFYGLLWGIGGFLIGLFISLLLGNMLLKNPFSLLLEGKGLLVIDLESTGIIKPFIVMLKSPYIQGNFDGAKIKDVFDRNAVYQLSPPIINEIPAEVKNGKLVLRLDETQYNQSKFSMLHYPVLLWNNQVKSFITKDFLSSQEKEVFAEHGVLYLNRIMEELTSVVRDFGRYVVELLKPKESLFKNKIFWIILVGGLILLGALFLPKIIGLIQGKTSAAIGSTGAISGNQVITPK